MMRALLPALLAAMLWLGCAAPAAAQGDTRGTATFLTGARMWPAAEYTRVTLEARAPVHWNLFSIEHPDRLVLDLEGLEPSAATDALPGRVRRDDPWVRAIRVGRFKPGTLRIVLDLKQPVQALAALLDPAGDYGYRLVIDIHPVTPADPLMSLLAGNERAAGGPAANGGAPNPAVEGSDPPAAPAATPGWSPMESAPAPASRPPPGDAAATAAATSSAAQTELPRVPQPVASAPPLAANPYGPVGETPPPPGSARAREAVALDGRHGKAAERMITIAIDAGHGGEDPGAHGDGGTLEKDVTLAIARRIREIVNQEPGLRGVLIRDDDYFIPLQGRTAKARQIRADLFVSIHADAYINRDARGSSVFALSEHGATSVAARWLASRENQADLVGGVNLSSRDPFLARTLFDLAQTATIQDSLRLARTVLKELGALNPLHRGEVEQAGFAVLKSPDIPSILVETAFITNPAEERRLGDTRYQDRLASTIVRGLRRYLVAHPPAGKPRLTGDEPPAAAGP